MSFDQSLDVKVDCVEIAEWIVKTAERLGRGIWVEDSARGGKPGVVCSTNGNYFVFYSLGRRSEIYYDSVRRVVIN